MSKKVPPSSEQPPQENDTSNLTEDQLRQVLDTVLNHQLHEVLDIANKIDADHGETNGEAFLLNFLTSMIASIVYTTIKKKIAEPKKRYRLVKSAIQEAVASGFEEAFTLYSPKTNNEFYCTLELIPKPVSELQH